MSEHINPYADENVYDTPEYRKEVIAEYKRLEERRIYLATQVISMFKLKPAIPSPQLVIEFEAEDDN